MIKKLLGTLLCLFALCSVAVAQDKDPEGYEKVDGSMMAPGEAIPADRLVGAAYGFIFASLAVYVASVVSRGRRVEEEMDVLRRKLEAKGK